MFVSGISRFNFAQVEGSRNLSAEPGMVGFFLTLRL